TPDRGIQRVLAVTVPVRGDENGLLPLARPPDLDIRALRTEAQVREVDHPDAQQVPVFAVLPGRNPIDEVIQVAFDVRVSYQGECHWPPPPASASTPGASRGVGAPPASA